MAIVLLLPLYIVLVGLVLAVQYIAVYFWDSKRLRKYHNLNLLCGISNLGYILHLWKSDRFRTRAIHVAHCKHDVIRIGPNALSFSSVGAIQDIYGHSTLCGKGDMYSTPAGPHRSILDSVNKQEHSLERKRLSAAFATKHLEDWEHKVLDKCQRLVAQLDRHCMSAKDSNEPEAQLIDLRKWLNLFTIEAIADIAMSERLGFLEQGEDTIVLPGVENNDRQVGFVQSLHGVGRVVAPFVWSKTAYPILKKIVPFFSSSYSCEVDNNSNFDDIVRRMTLRRLQRHYLGEKIDDLFTCLIEDKQGKPTGLPMEEITAEVSVFMNAGSDTTAIALTHVIYYLSKNRDKLRRLREELTDCLSMDCGIPAYADVKCLPYLRACLDESLRLSPPVSFGLERKTPPEGASIDGKWIARGTMVSVPAYTAHRDPFIFPDPENFVPERWLKKESKHIQKYFIPFSTGARGYLGRNISYIEQHILLATFVQRYEFELQSPCWKLQWEERFNLWPSAMPMRLRHRVNCM